MLAKQKSVSHVLGLTVLFLLLRKAPEPPDKLETILQQDDEESRFNRIRCPLCRWRPDSSSRWMCGGSGPPEYFKGCGTYWNTFDTHGQCPGCKHQWHWTACLWCRNYSLHEAWYTNEED